MKLLSLITLAASATAVAIDKRQTCANANAAGLARADKAFDDAKIVPDVIPDFKPTLELTVTYPAKKVDFGNTFNTLREWQPQITRL